VLTATGVPVSSARVGEVVEVTVATRHPATSDWSENCAQALPFHHRSEWPVPGSQMVMVTELKVLPAPIATS
jgi:hypothetical protein